MSVNFNSRKSNAVMMRADTTRTRREDPDHDSRFEKSQNRARDTFSLLQNRELEAGQKDRPEHDYVPATEPRQYGKMKEA